MWGQTPPCCRYKVPQHSLLLDTNPAQGITCAGTYWGSSWGAQQTKQAELCNYCHRKVPSISPYVHIYPISYPRSRNKPPARAQPPSTKPCREELLLIPGCADPRLWHQQSCVCKGFHQNSCVSKIKLKTKKNPTTLTSPALWWAAGVEHKPCSRFAESTSLVQCKMENSAPEWVHPLSYFT